MNAKPLSQSSTLIFTLILLASLLACNGDDETLQTCKDSKSTTKIYFEGIFLTDANGVSIGGGDTEDWQTQDTWLAQELSLFDDNSQSICPTNIEQKVYPSYPNPSNGIFNLTVYNSSISDLSLRFVDENFQTLRSHEFPQLDAGSNSFAFNFQDLNLSDTIRLYYKVIQTDCAFRGHGDILINP